MYWLTDAVAAIIAIFVVVDFFIGLAQGYPIIRVVALIAALVICRIGRIGRSLLSQG